MGFAVGSNNCELTPQKATSGMGCGYHLNTTRFLTDEERMLVVALINYLIEHGNEPKTFPCFRDK